MKTNYLSLAALAALIAAILSPQSLKASITDGATDIGYGWMHSDWFGDFMPSENNWFYHDKWGWIYQYDSGAYNAWFYASDEEQWFFGESESYPYVYDSGNGGWLWFWDDTTDPRVYYDYSISAWTASDDSNGEIWRAYYLSIVDAKTAEADEIYDGLTPVADYNNSLTWNDSHTMIKVVSWMPDTYISSYTVGEEITMNWESWVTLCPQVQEFAFNSGLTTGELPLRMKQLIGLRPDRDYAYWVEFWVYPEDLFRPAPDPSPVDCVANLDFSTSPETSVSDSYREWFASQAESSYILSRNGFPWTRLGYTYDWASDSSEVGLSEYVIRSGTTALVDSIYTNDEYLSSE